MTLTERVLRHLEETMGRWMIVREGSLRTTGTRLCPLESLRGWRNGEVMRRLGQWKWRRFWFGGIGKRERAILDAADLAYSHDPALRAAMLEAAGLEEEEATT